MAGSPRSTGRAAMRRADLAAMRRAKFSKPGGCGKDIPDARWEVTLATDEPGWMLDATIQGTREAGTYTIGFHAARAATILL